MTRPDLPALTLIVRRREMLTRSAGAAGSTDAATPVVPLGEDEPELDDEPVSPAGPADVLPALPPDEDVPPPVVLPPPEVVPPPVVPPPVEPPPVEPPPVEPPPVEPPPVFDGGGATTVIVPLMWLW